MSVGRVLHAARRLRVQFALIVALAMAPAGLMAIMQAASNIEKAIASEEEVLRKQARRASEEERTAILAIREVLRVTARNPAVRGMQGQVCDDALNRLVAADDRFSGALVTNMLGQSVCGPERDFDISGTSAYRSYIESPRIVVGPVRLGRLSGRNMMLALAPIVGSDTENGILAVGLSADFFRSLTTDKESAEVQLALVDAAGAIFAENESRRGTWLPPDVSAFLDEDERFVTLGGEDGVVRSYYVAPLPIDRIWMVAAKPHVTWGAMLIGANGLQLVTPLLLWAIAVAVAFFVIDRLVSRHIVYLQRVAGSIGRGNLSIGRLRLDGAPYEIKRLGDALETMADRLAEREATLRANIETKRALLLEVHHRVKNNLQMISSLMNMQLRRTRSTDERHSLQIVQDRIHSLALVHQHLYAADRLDAVSLDRLVEDLVRYLCDSLCPPSAKVDISFDLNPMDAGADIANPVALFVTEAVSNTFKHCFGPGVTGHVAAALAPGDEETFVLTLTNDRPCGSSGEPAKGGLGSRLMEGFANQIGGRLEYDVSETRYEVRLVAPLKPRGRTFALRHRTASGDNGERASDTAAEAAVQ